MTRLHSVCSVRNCALVVAIAAAGACDKKEDAPAPAKEEAVAKAEEPAKKAEPAKAEAKEETKAPEPEPTKVEEPAKPAPAASRELLAYVPESAVMVFVADPKAVARASLFDQSGTFMTDLQKSRIGEVYTGAKACNAGVDSWASLLVAGASDSEDHMIVGLRATGIGKKETVECLAGKINAVAEAGKWTVSEEGGRVGFAIEGRDNRGFAASDDVLLVAGKSYIEDVEAILDGSGKSAADGALGKLVQRVDRSRHVYFAAVLPPGAGGPMTNVQNVMGTLDFSSGLAVGMSLEFADAASASTSAEMLRSYSDILKGQAGALGVPATTLASLKIDTKDKIVVASASASKADLEAMATTFQKQL